MVWTHFFAGIVLIYFASLASAQSGKATQTVKASSSLSFEGEIKAPKDISAVARMGKFLIIGGDEGNIVQLLKPGKNQGQYTVFKNIELPVKNPKKNEVDIEGIAISGNTVFVTGSYSGSRKSIKSSASYAKNLDRIKKVSFGSNRKLTFSFDIDPQTGELRSDKRKVSLTKLFKKNDILDRFRAIPSKENGIDIEGLAASNDSLFFGFRGPILRGNWVPIVKTKFEDIKKANRYELMFINLKGNGIRDMEAIPGGVLILAGPMGDGFSPYQLYFWNGNDMIPGSNNTGKLKYVTKIPTPEGAKAEGLTVLSSSDSKLELLIVYDGIKGGNPTVVNVEKPSFQN